MRSFINTSKRFLTLLKYVRKVYIHPAYSPCDSFFDFEYNMILRQDHVILKAEKGLTTWKTDLVEDTLRQSKKLQNFV